MCLINFWKLNLALPTADETIKKDREAKYHRQTMKPSGELEENVFVIQ